MKKFFNSFIIPFIFSFGVSFVLFGTVLMVELSDFTYKIMFICTIISAVAGIVTVLGVKIMKQ